MSEPLIWTSKGNIPMEGLQHDVEWRVSPEQIIFIERYLLDGEVVKESAHVKVLTGVVMSGEASI
jgi:hypothetical protein